VVSYFRFVERLKNGWRQNRTELLMFFAGAAVASSSPVAKYIQFREWVDLVTLAAFLFILVPLFVSPLFPRPPEDSPTPKRFGVGPSDPSQLWARRAEARTVVERIEAHAVTVVCGLSGAGKSVLVTREVIPTLERAGWKSIVVHTYDNLPDKLMGLLIQCGALDDEGAASFKEASIFRPSHRVAIIFDQAERLIHASIRQNQWLTSFLRNIQAPARSVLIVRDDQYYRLKGLGIMPAPSEAIEIEGIAPIGDMLDRLNGVADESVVQKVVSELQALASTAPIRPAGLEIPVQMVGLMLEDLKGFGGPVAYDTATGEFGTLGLLRRYITLLGSHERPPQMPAVLFALSKNDPRRALEHRDLERLTSYSPAEAQSAVHLLLEGLTAAGRPSSRQGIRSDYADLLAELAVEPVTQVEMDALKPRVRLPVAAQGVLPIHIQMVGVMLEDLGPTVGGGRVDQKTFHSVFGTLGLLRRYFKRYLSSSPDEKVAEAVMFGLSTGDPRRRLTRGELVHITYYSPKEIDQAIAFLERNRLIVGDGNTYELTHDTLAVLFRDYSGLHMNAAQRDGIAYVAGKPDRSVAHVSRVLIDGEADNRLRTRRLLARLLFGVAAAVSLARIAADALGFHWIGASVAGATLDESSYWPFGVAHLAGGAFIYRAVEYFMRLRADPSRLQYWLIPAVGILCMFIGTVWPRSWLLMIAVTGGLVGLKWLFMSRQDDVADYSKGFFFVQARNYLSFALVGMGIIGLLSVVVGAGVVNPVGTAAGAETLALVVAAAFLLQRPSLTPYLGLLDRVYESNEVQKRQLKVS
jgi:hypothetical protein